MSHKYTHSVFLRVEAFFPFQNTHFPLKNQLSDANFVYACPIRGRLA